jgi:hypothetical protein
VQPTVHTYCRKEGAGKKLEVVAIHRIRNKILSKAFVALKIGAS